MAVKIHAPLDTSHSPFKRMSQIGPGPKNRMITAKEKYVCARSPNTKYLQYCMVVDGPGKGRVFKVKTNPATKKKYNKLYNEKRDRAAASNNYRAGFKLSPMAKMTEAGKASRIQPSRRAPIDFRVKKKK